MNHEEASGLLADFADGRLEPGLTEEVARHQSSCSDCRQWLEVYRLLQRHPDALHPASEHLAARAVGRDVPGDVKAHIEECAECWRLVTDAAEAWRRAEPAEVRELGAGLIERPPPSATPWRGLAAGLAAALLVSLLALASLFQPSPGTSHDGSWAGPVDALVLAPAVRSGSNAESLRIQPGQPSVAVALDLGSMLEEFDGPIEIRLTRLPADEVWRATYESQTLHSLELETGLIMLQWPTSILPPGSYRVEFEGSGEAPTWQRRFTVVLDDP